jgi:hypothetical protein
VLSAEFRHAHRRRTLRLANVDRQARWPSPRSATIRPAGRVVYLDFIELLQLLDDFRDLFNILGRGFLLQAQRRQVLRTLQAGSQYETAY